MRGPFHAIMGPINDAVVKKLTYKTVRLLSPHLREGERVLDIGCGFGYQMHMLQKSMHVSIEGIDVVDYHEADMPMKKFDGVSIPYPDKAFDASYLAFVLHHAERPVDLLHDAMRVSKHRVIIIEDTPRNGFDRNFDRLHGWMFNRYYHLDHQCVFRSVEEWHKIFDSLGIKKVQTVRLSRWVREPYFPISRTTFVLDVT